MLNKCFLLGRMTKDPEIRRTNGGTAVTSFTLAVDRDFKTNGEKETDFIEVVAWRNTAEFVSKYFSKGRLAITDQRVDGQEWEQAPYSGGCGRQRVLRRLQEGEQGGAGIQAG